MSINVFFGKKKIRKDFDQSYLDRKYDHNWTDLNINVFKNQNDHNSDYEIKKKNSKQNKIFSDFE